ncbi:MAG: hypothetical protein GY953_35875, partial [bacterium]|nr:hypothetical protein [bacterium]
MRHGCSLLTAVAVAAASLVAAPPPADMDGAVRTVRSFNFRSVRDAVEDLSTEFGSRYPRGAEFLRRLHELETAREHGTGMVKLARELDKLRYEALLANPLLDFDQLLVVKRSYKTPIARPTKKRPWATSPFYTNYGLRLGLPVNHYSIASIEPHAWDNEIAVLSPVRPDGQLTTFFRPENRAWLGEMDLHWDADRLLFTMPVDGRYRVFEIGA